MTDRIVSTGRGGQGNIGKDSTKYTDAGIVHEGVIGEGRKPEFSTGRGGAGNIAHPLGSDAHAGQDHIPEANVRSPQEVFHTGRGGGGNVYKEKYGGHSNDPEKHKTIGDKIKGILHKDDEKKPE